MDKIIKNILSKIENEGYEAYIVGGFVRDKLLGISSYDVDVCTNALPKDLKKIFNITQNGNGYGGFNLKIKKYNVDITTYREEKDYSNRHPMEVVYVNNLITDINRRDFTINSLCMDKTGNITDLLDAKTDLYNKNIKVIGAPNKKFKEDPLRMLRAIRFATILDFNIESDTYEGIVKNSKYTESLSSERIKEEISKILSSKNYQKGLDLLKKTNINKYIDLNFTSVSYCEDILGMWAQIDCPKVRFSKSEQDIIRSIKKIVQIGRITNFELFNHGLYLCTIAGEIIGVSKKSINELYKKMPIKSMKDIAISGKDIMGILDTNPSKIIGEIMADIKIRILNNQLKNSKVEIRKYITENWKNE